MTSTHRQSFRTVLAFAAVLAATTASAQSNYYPPTPAQGPPPNLSASSQSFGIDTFITHHCCDPMTMAFDGVYDKIDQAVAENNASYGIASSGAVVTPTKKRYSPWMYATQSTDRPNQNIVLISYYINYDLTNIYWHGIPYPFSRTAGQSIDIEISCEGWYPWYRGQGQLTLTSKVSRPVLDSDHSVLEDTLGGILWRNAIPDLVDSQITAKLGTFASGTHRRALGFSCNTLGEESDATSPNFDSILWDFVQPRNWGTALDYLNQISVRVTQVRRLTVHDLSNNVVYYPLENPRLELYVGYKHLVVNLPPMVEGQVFVPDASAVVSGPIPPATAQYSGNLVIIADMWQVPQNMEDTAFLVFDKAANFGAGTRVVNTPKIWSYISSLSRKPVIMRSKSYEVTLEISGPPTIAGVFTTF